ncbi:MAG: hypothetical protein ISS18_08750 [Bacteroidales bacterium]|nr:hypothetical protein [Bacteroidales bacterium]
MKKVIKLLVVTAFFLTAPLFMMAQNPPHPNGGSAPGSGNTPVGGGAPIGGGLIIMLALGMGYGARKIYDARRKVLD